MPIIRGHLCVRRTYHLPLSHANYRKNEDYQLQLVPGETSIEKIGELIDSCVRTLKSLEGVYEFQFISIRREDS